MAAAGWATLGNLVALKNDDDIDLAELNRLLERVAKTIHQQPNRVRYVMNGFVIAVGSHVSPLTDLAEKIAAKMGEVWVDMGGTACKTPDATQQIDKVRQRGSIGKKKKTVKC